MGYQEAPIVTPEDVYAMPTYDYQCGKCGEEFTREQRITEPPVKTCPKCKSRQVKRLLSAPGFILKGGGWYSDLYSSSGKKSGGGSGTGEGGSGGSGDSSSSGSSSSPESSGSTGSSSGSSGSGSSSGDGGKSSASAA
jgi:putative FmdB family regulatory protein